VPASKRPGQRSDHAHQRHLILVPEEASLAIFVLASVLGVTIGYLLGGRAHGLAELGLRAFWLVWVALACSLLAYLPGIHALEPAFLGATFVLVCGFFLLNARAQRSWLRFGLVIVAAGWMLNGAAIVANGGMPVPRSVLERPASRLDHALDVHRFEHTVLAPSTQLRWLADVIPTPCLAGGGSSDRGQCGAVSVGDLLLIGGLAMVEAAAMVTGSRRRRTLPSSPELAP
jgi:Family of unknown function (DUF5317)